MTRKILYLGLDPHHYQGEGEVVHWPIIEIIPRPLTDPSLQQSLRNFDRYSHIILTSKSTVSILDTYLKYLGFGPDDWKGKIILAVGKVTASHLRELQINPTYTCQEETAEGMIEQLRHLNLKNGHLFWPHSSKARPLISQFLKEEGVSFTECLLYDPRTREKITPLPDVNSFDEIVFTSPSTVEAFLKIFKTFPVGAQLSPIGPVTAKKLPPLHI